MRGEEGGREVRERREGGEGEEGGREEDEGEEGRIHPYCTCDIIKSSFNSTTYIGCQW